MRDVNTVTFNAKDGYCPQFVAPNGDVYMIADKRVGASYQYRLVVKNRKPETITFDSMSAVEEYIESKTNRKRYEYMRCNDGKIGYLLYDVTIVRGPDNNSFIHSGPDCRKFRIVCLMSEFCEGVHIQTDHRGKLKR